ncbi:transposase [Crocosphaera sp. UHCC 0190]|uniref:RNA-guided endonuclease InsQ/TnpB family protein n=1 Tax=Crocosphaera sp. UHCC 0190 TaxID=3110246 RepID=UPI002B208646|nr:transposase [Crocosphaera sp. UHCC 0190]MEA5510572.1 transposase [Crocosphaera sp. UHCC 0190]
MLTLNYSYRIYPDSEQEALLDEWLETCRRSYNYALRELKDWIASRKCPIDRCSLESEYIMAADYPFPSYHQQQNQLPKAKKVFPSLGKVPSQVLQTNVKRLHDAWDFFRNRGFGFPRFKKYGQMKSLLFPQFRSNPLTGWQINLPKLGKVQINLHRPIPDGFVIKQVRVLKKAKGWFAIISIQSDMSLPEIETPFGHPLGLDVGITKIVATSDGFIEKGRKFFRTEQRKLKLLQHRLSKKNKHSNNYDKARKKVEKQHNHIAFKRKDYHYKLAHQICDMGDSIFMEDIDFRIMAKGFLSKHTLDAGFGQFRDLLKYVCKIRGKYFGLVDHRGTSQTCPNCRSSSRKTLADRIHDCPECQYQCDRDVASAQEICNRGIETTTLGLRGKETVCQVEVSGVISLDNWRRGATAVLGFPQVEQVACSIPLWAEISQCELGSPPCTA